MDEMNLCSTFFTNKRGSETNSMIEENNSYQNRKDNNSEEEYSEIYLSLIWNRGKLGAAYYDTSTCLLHLFSDQPEVNPDFPLVKLMLKQVQPTVVLISSRTDENLIKILLQHKNLTDLEDIMTNQTNKFIQFLPYIQFSYEAARHYLRFLNIPSIPKNLNETEKHIYLSALINFTNISLVRSCGALLNYLQKERIGIQLEEESASVPVLGITAFSLRDIVNIDENSFSALQIFNQQSMLSASANRNTTREDLSLYGIINKCKSSFGSKYLKKLLLQPTQDIEILKQRQDAVAYFVTPQNVEVVYNLQNCLKNIKHIPRILSHMLNSHASVNDWKALYKTVYNSVLIKDICGMQPQSIYIFRKITETFTSDLCRISSLINKIIDFQESDNQNHFVVKPGVDERLDYKKRTYNGLPDFMTKVAQKELEKLSSEIQECNVIYLPQLGYLLAIPLTEKMKTEECYDIPGLEFIFFSNNMVHYKSANTKELDSLLGDTQCEIIDHETWIMHKLQNVILETSNVLLNVMNYSAELDCLISLALIAKEFNYIRPEITRDGILHIVKGRHPLQEHCVSSFVPNDTKSGGKYGKVKLLTGPNASGKSVYLKQVALIVYLAHIGSFVPAEMAKITIIDHIFTRIHTVESISVGLSTFMIDINQMSVALRYATSNSLVIIDEFGKGTEAMDGLALLASSLQFWLKENVNCPHCFVSTHFHSLLNILNPAEQLCYQTMDTLLEDGNLIFLYQLKDGKTDGSYAHHVATLAGIPSKLVDRAKEIADILKNNKEIIPIKNIANM
ncbi:mutS protein homolog 5-like isoform X3 [Centruroides vittatus]|uniref:mutS protein homolog 5-like isoform X3 n=1 Tax=Centruroides vittatus TaxID=120091 RepID=UPI00350F9FD2